MQEYKNIAEIVLEIETLEQRNKIQEALDAGFTDHQIIFMFRNKML